MIELNGLTPDIVKENTKELRKLFPEVFTEGKIDFDKFKQVLGEYVDDNKERYNFTWNGKGRALRLAQTPSTGTLRPCKEESKEWDTTQNLYIEGDNLEVLKLLQKSYHSKVKMIYIDPPYNTGNDFVYADDFSNNIDNYKKITGQISEAGSRISTNSETSGRYHTDWLNMMYPRLRLARNLLADDGVIFMSIDDNEQSNLEKISNEIFGEDNFVANVAVKLSEPTGVKMAHVEQRIPKLKEYIVLFKKSNKISISPALIDKENWDREYSTFCNGIENDELIKIKEITKNENRTDEDILYAETILKKVSFENIASVCKKQTGEDFDEKWCFDNAHRIVQFATLTGGAKDLAVNKKKKLISNLPPAFSIITPKNKMYLINAAFNDKTDLPRCKILFADQYLQVNTGDFWQDIKTTGLDNEGFVPFKNGKKPLKMLKRCLELTVDKDSIILDFFSGSATTAHAVMQLNAEDNGKRKFIMVQLPELCEENTEAYKSGYKNICEIGKERIRLAGEKIKEDAGLMALNLDIGFKVFKLDSSNLKKWNPDYNDLETSLYDSINNYVEARTEMDVVYEIMIKMGLDLTYPVVEHIISDKKVYEIGNGALMMCLDDDITTDVAQGMIKLKNELQPEIWKVVFKDNGFASDSNKTNIKEILKCAGLKEEAFTTV